MKRMTLLVAASMAMLSSAAFGQNVGDVVYLKSGSPTMTVTEILPRSDLSGTDVGVKWFGGASMMAATFPATALVVIDPGPVLTKAQLDEKCRIFPPKATGEPCL